MSDNNKVDLTYDVSQSNVIFAIYEKTCIENGYTHICIESYDVELDDLPIRNQTHSLRNRNSFWTIYEYSDSMVRVSLSHGSTISISVSAATVADAKKRMQAMKRLIPENVVEENEDNIFMNFWSDGTHGPNKINRKLVVPSWDEIRANYSKPTKDQLDRLLRPDFNPGHGGQLILWQGDPGTGKTTALRALAKEWREWATFNYITDPERFFGSNANYMLNLLTMEEVDYEYDELGNFTTNDKKEKWKLLILEDCGELLGADARVSSGQGLSRFLNCVDGLIGQGLQILVLVTTNEPLGKLHSAVQRAGRTAARIEFETLTEAEASKWIGHEVKERKTIAELYAEKNEFSLNNSQNNGSIGFS